MDKQVKCKKMSGGKAHEHIVQLGGGTAWKPMSVADVIKAIETKTDTFHTLVDGKRAEVRVREPSTGKKYVQTIADGVWKDNLLALPDCVD
jgi:hypothetical protein